MIHLFSLQFFRSFCSAIDLVFCAVPRTIEGLKDMSHVWLSIHQSLNYLLNFIDVFVCIPICLYAHHHVPVGARGGQKLSVYMKWLDT